LWLLAGIAIAAGAGAAAWFAMQGQPSGGEPSLAPSVAPAPVTSQDESEAVDLLLEKARTASNSGQLFEPRGSSAFDFYQKARELDPGNPSAAAGLDLLLVNTVERAKQYMAQGELDLAQQELGRAALVNPSDNYLMSAREDLANAVNAKLEAAIAAQQLQQDSDQAPLERQELTAANSDTTAQDSEPAEQQPATELTTSTPVALESAETTLQTRSIPELLSQAQADMERDTADSRDAALAALQQVQERVPANEDAATMLQTLLDQYLEVARIEAEKGNFQKAKRAMDSARRIDPDAQPSSTTGGVAELLATGVSLEEQGEYQAAVKTYLEALLIDPDSPDIDASLHRVHQLYVDAIQQHLANGEQEQAAALRTEALTWFPNSELLQNSMPQATPPAPPDGG
jgi:tetratricopeptide (TPR) repeat protein